QATVPVSGAGKVKLTLTNIGNTHMGNIQVLNILPKLNDKMVLNPAAGKGSTWNALAGTVSITVYDNTGKALTEEERLAQFPNMKVEYDANNNPSYKQNGFNRTGTNGTFTPGTAAEEAGSFLFTSGESRLPPGYKLELYFEIAAPADIAAGAINQPAYNSFAANTTFYDKETGTNGEYTVAPFEPDKQKLVIIESGNAAITGGTVFKDLDADGLFAAGEEYAGVTVELYAEDGKTPSQPSDTLLDTTVTKADGTYTFESLDGGNYFVKIVLPQNPANLPEGYGYSFAPVGNTATSSYANPQTGFLPLVSLNSGGASQAKPAGIQAKGLLQVQYRSGSATGTSLLETPIVTDFTEFPLSTNTGTIIPGSTTGYIVPDYYDIKAGEKTELTYAVNWATLQDTLVFVFAPNEFTITYTLGEGVTNAPGNPASYTIESSDITLAAPSRAGYEFMGWVGTGNQPDTATLNYVLQSGSTGNRTYAPEWKLITYTIEYDLNDADHDAYKGVLTDAPVSYTVEDLPGGVAIPNPTREGYTFAGWAGGDIEDGKTALGHSLQAGTTGNLTFVATWQRVPIAVQFQTNGGTPVPATQSKWYGETATTPATEPQKEGFSFDGWYTEETGGTEWDFTTPLYADLVLYAHYAQNSYVVTFDYNDGTGVPGSRNVLFGNLVEPPANVQRTGYHLIEGSEWLYIDEGRSWNFGTDTMPAKNITLQAQWQKNNYTVTYLYGWE
ncbi:InlB B-repeat-containing protein, partial [Ruminococcaceae bacterium OttesenSCG-928-A16]|nr:InlB B-repeat-containing protein [Ruminococcaceae bacterium OttesenSCG-928-A16]